MSGIKRKPISLDTKLQVVRALESGEKKSEVAKRFGLVYSTITSLWSAREKIKASATTNCSFKAKKMRKANIDDLDQGLLKWFTQQRCLNIPVSGPILKAKAEQLAGLIGLEKYECSPSWIERFKKRHEINCSKVCGEASDVNKNITDAWITTEWTAIREQYRKEDIFNGDETGLFFKMSPNSTLKFKTEKCTGGKLSKDRLTVFVCANASGTEKRELLVIGKSKKPRCFKNVKKLPLKYTSNKRAWMVSDIFERELRSWDEELTKKKRNICLLLDNCTAHPHIQGLRSIRLVFLPANTTSVLQPMDQGVIRSLKSTYRKHLLLEALQTGQNLDLKNISVLDACRTLKKAWDDVTVKTIQNSFLHSGLISGEFDEEDLQPLSQWVTSNGLSKADYEFVECEETPDTTAVLTDAEIVESVSSKDDSDVEDDEEEEAEAPVTLTEARQILKKLTHFFECTGDDMGESLRQIDTRINQIYNRTCHQKKITDFF